MNIQCNSYVFVSIINVINFHTAIDNVFNNKQCAYFSSPTLPCAYCFIDLEGSMCLALCLFFLNFEGAVLINVCL